MFSALTFLCWQCAIAECIEFGAIHCVLIHETQIEISVFNEGLTINYRKIRGLYFSKALFEGLIFGGAYVRRKICVSKSIGLACSEKEIYHFCFVLLCIRGQIPSTSPSGAYMRRGDLTEGFCITILGGLYLEGLIHGGAYFRNFTVC